MKNFLIQGIYRLQFDWAACSAKIRSRSLSDDVDGESLGKSQFENLVTRRGRLLLEAFPAMGISENLTIVRLNSRQNASEKCPEVLR